jgi:hypothetical protein
MGIKTVYEIEQKRYTLKALRGDYEGVSRGEDKASATVKAAEA